MSRKPSSAPKHKDAPMANVPAVAHGTEVMPDWMKQYAGQGSENITADDMLTPRVKLMQALSPELQEHDGVRQGEFFHSVAEQSLGNNVRIVILHISRQYILWNPLDQGGGMLAKSEDGVHWDQPNKEFVVKINKGTKTVTYNTRNTVAESGLAEWGSAEPGNSKSHPAADLVYNLAVYLPDHPELSPSVVSLSKSALAAAKGLLGKLRISRAPVYCRYVKMSSAQARSDAGTYWTYKFSLDGLVADQAEGEAYREMAMGFATSGIKVATPDQSDASATVVDNDEVAF